MPITSSSQEEKQKSVIAWQDMPGKESLKQKLTNHPVDQCALKLWFEGIDDTDAKLISRFLKMHSNITSLNLQWNNIGDEGAKALAKNVTLTSLNLEWNKIGDEVLAEVNRAIDSNKALYLSFIEGIDEIKSWSAKLLEYFTRYVNMKSSTFSDEENNIYKTAHKNKIDEIATDFVKQGKIYKTEESKYAVSVINDSNLGNMPLSSYDLMNSYIEPDNYLTREDITHALEMEINGNITDTDMQC